MDEFETSDRAPLVPNAQENGLETVLVVQDEGERRTEEQRTGTSTVETETICRIACTEHLNSNRNAVERVLPLCSAATEFTSNTPFSVLPLSSAATEFTSEQIAEETASSVETETRIRRACAEHLYRNRSVERVLPLSSAMESTSGRVAGNTPFSKEFTSEELVEKTGTSSVETETRCRRTCTEHLNSSRNAVETVLPLSSATTEFTSGRVSGYAPYLRSPEEGRHSWPMPWMSMPPSLLADQPSIQAPSFVPVQAEVAIDSKADSYVRTDDLEEAFDVLEDKGRVVLCAPPGAGKTAVAHALLRRCRDEGFEPCVFTDIKDWQTHVAEGKRTAVLLDGTLGEVRVDPEQYRQWRSLLGSILPLTSQGDCRLVVTLYPHILKELSEIEPEFSSLLLDKLSVVRLLRKDLKNETKKNMLQFHFKNLEIAPSLQEELMEAVLAKDVSGSVFPWCCCYLAEHWHLTQDPELGFAKNYAHSKSPNPPDIPNPNSKSQIPPYIPGPNSKSQNPPDILYPSSKSKNSSDISNPSAIWQADDIFTHPEEAYIPLLKRMLRHGSHGKTFAAVLALTMKGLGGFLHDDERVEPHLGQLRFERFSEYHLSEYADVLKGFILSADGDYGFASRVLYDAAGLALGRAFSLPVLLQVCDDRFLVKYVRAFKNSPLDPFVVYTGAEPKVRDLFMERVYDGVLHGNHAELCQHPELCSTDFQKEFEAFCSRRKKNLQQWVASLDAQHAMTLLYWSTWSSTDQLTRWCLDIIYRTYFFRKVPTESLLCSALMCVIFTQPASLARDRAKPFAEELLKVMAKVTKAEELLGDDTPVIIEFPYPGDVLTLSAKHKERVLLERAKNPSAIPFAPDIITPVVVSADDKTVSVKMTKCAWCWTVLSAAQGRVGGPKTEDTGTQELDPRLVARFLQGSSATGRMGPAFMRDLTGSLVGAHGARTLSVGEIVGYTPRDLHNAIKRGDLADATAYLCVYKCATLDDRLSNSCTPLHSAAGSGQHKIADFLLQLGADVNAQMFTHSDTPLHVACGAGDERMATVLLQFGADVNVAGFGGYFPIHRACALGHQGIVELLLSREADVNTRTLCGERTTPLHVACFHGHVDLIKCLLRHGANIKAKNGDGRTPLDVARKKGMSEVVDLMLAVLGDDVSSTPDRVSVVL